MILGMIVGAGVFAAGFLSGIVFLITVADTTRRNNE